MTDAVAEARRAYAEDLRSRAGLRSEALVEAFATVPRERFVGPAPWRIKNPSEFADFWTVTGPDPRPLYQDVLVALDRARGINNGQPSLWAQVFDRLDLRPGMTIVHLGCGTGYYTAILAEAVGPDAPITAVEIDAGLVARAREALSLWPQVRVVAGDGAKMALPEADLVVASAGATHPLALWLDALAPGGQLLFPMTSAFGPGAMLLVTRRTGTAHAAEFLCGAAFIAFVGARDEAIGRRLASALSRDGGDPVRSLRRDEHAEEASCWLHGRGWCLSRREPG
ncbi:O-methyltransferase [Kaistia sp. 32K]|uniref:protein-L-isoaspartate O-methyltransferase family protein n=1 Tax=Kaistia sp. 32K TaxID=2795690 RepID=UPI0019158584|nr:methyltransferase domain-containing protein [Kaistia sp. 32K]BCP52809.1 O-methyltransferase [Kaistia sp. 32K]